MCGNNTLPKKQRLPKKPANGQIPQWSDALQAWVAKDISGAGTNAYLYIAYADDGTGAGFTTSFNPGKFFIAVKQTNMPIIPVQSQFTGLWFRYKGADGNDGKNGKDGIDGLNGQSAYIYMAYADSANGDGFTSKFESGKTYIAIVSSSEELNPNDPKVYEDKWVRYIGQDGNNGANGTNGQNAYVYIAYADDVNGNGFTTSFNASKNFIAIRASNTLLTVTQATFAGLWYNYKGAAGSNGNNGSNGINGQSAYIYIGYADDLSGSGYTSVFDSSKAYIAIKSSTVALTPNQATFDGLWVKYKGDDAVVSGLLVERQDLDQDTIIEAINNKYYLLNPKGNNRKVLFNATSDLVITVKNTAPEGEGSLLDCQNGISEETLKNLSAQQTIRLLFSNDHWEVL